MKATAGKRNRLVAFQQRATGRNSTGQPVETWNNVALAWVRIQSLNGSENFTQGQFAPEVTHLVSALPIEVNDITPMHRILTDEGVILDILYINNPERPMDGEVLITCKQRIGQDASPAALLPPGPGYATGPVIGFTATANPAVFTLDGIPLGTVQVFLNGMLLTSPGDFSISGATLTFVSAPSGGDKIEIYQLR